MKTRKTAGFTLIELMVALVVVAILAAIAYPSYNEFTARAKRAEGKAALLKAAQLQERWYTINNQYSTTIGPLFGLGAGAVYSGENPALTSGWYVLSVVVPAGNQTYTLTATPNNLTSFSTDAKCGNLTLDSTGTRNKVGGSETLAYCWNR